MSAMLTESEWRLLKGRHDDEWFIVAGDMDADGGPDLHATILTANAADARLMAKGPEVLGSLEEVIRAWLQEANYGDGIDEAHAPILAKARAVIAKVKGETQ